VPTPAFVSDFPFHHGRVSLSFAGTLGYRGSAEPIERLGSPRELTAWLVAAGLLSARQAPVADVATYNRSIVLREAIWRIGDACVRGVKPKAADIAAVNDAAKRWSPPPALDPHTLRVVSREGADPLRAALGRVAVDAIELFGDTKARERFRACENDDCSSIFLDPGRGRARRWCSMSRCGNRAKVAAFRARQKEA
jgi:predicted RNA-binding Zn ribbon-like protein